MTFTPEEVAVIERFRKYQRQWRFLRWGLLLAGVLCAVVLVHVAYWMFLLVSRVSPSAPPTALDAWLLAQLHPQMILLIAIATWFIIRTLLQWRTGDPVVALLIRLTDDARAKKP